MWNNSNFCCWSSQLEEKKLTIFPTLDQSTDLMSEDKNQQPWPNFNLIRNQTSKKFRIFPVPIQFSFIPKHFSNCLTFQWKVLLRVRINWGKKPFIFIREGAKRLNFEGVQFPNSHLCFLALENLLLRVFELSSSHQQIRWKRKSGEHLDSIRIARPSGAANAFSCCSMKGVMKWLKPTITILFVHSFH